MAFCFLKKDHKHTFQDNISQKWVRWVRFLKITQKTDIMYEANVRKCYLV